jgi:starvation-inducible outer membrane lipoprotein
MKTLLIMAASLLLTACNTNPPKQDDVPMAGDGCYRVHAGAPQICAYNDKCIELLLREAGC